VPVDLIWRDRGVIFKCSGTMSGAEMIRSNEDAYGDPRWLKAHFKIVDLERLERAEVSENELEQAAALESKGSALNPDARLVVVKPKSADASVSNLTTKWFMEVHDKVTFSVRFAETMEEAEAML
jgi:hypothetical protein